MMKRIFVGIILVLLLTGILTLAFNIQPVSAEPRTWTVDDDGPADFHTIQEAINAANPGDAIYVKVGTYTSDIVVNKTLTLFGENKDTTIIDSDWIMVTANNAFIRGFTIQVEYFDIRPTLAPFEPGNVTLTPPPSGNIIENNNITLYPYQRPPFYLGSSINNTIRGNSIQIWGTEGIVLDKLQFITVYGSVTGPPSSENVIERNNITCMTGVSDGAVILRGDSFNNTVRNNSITGRLYTDIRRSTGIGLSDTENNSITGNMVVNCALGISFSWSSNNTVFHNNFINNTDQIRLSTSFNNTWDNGYPSGGNFWSNYTGVDADNDGLGDEPHTIDANNTDRYPLMGIFSDFNATSESCVQTICNSSISGFQYGDSSIRFNVTGEDGTAGFCRICIPTALMNATYRVFVNGTEVQCNLLPCSNSTHSYLYFTYSHSTKEILIIPELASLIILPLFMIATLIIVTIFSKKRIDITQRAHTHSLRVRVWCV